MPGPGLREQAGVRAPREQGLHVGDEMFWSRMGEWLHNSMDALGAPELEAEKR